MAAAGGRGDRVPLAGSIFKIARRPTGEKVVYARLFAGSLAMRQHVAMLRRDAFGGVEQFEERVTGIDRFVSGGAGGRRGQRRRDRWPARAATRAHR